MSTNSGKQYGLLIRKKQQPQLSRKSVFEDSDDEAEKKKVEKLIVKESMKNLVKRKTQVEMKKALEEDPTVYDYDNIYEDIQKKKEIAKAAKIPKDQKPRYIESLLKSAEHRKKENERRVERQIQKERLEEGEKFADKEAFVTSAYKQKMQEMQEEEEREERDRQLEEMMDVRKQNDLSGFYRHFLNQSTGEEAIPEFGKRFSKSDSEARRKAIEALVKQEPTTNAADDQSGKGGNTSADVGKRRKQDKHDSDSSTSSDDDGSKKASSSKEKRLKMSEEISKALRKRDTIPKLAKTKDKDADSDLSSDSSSSQDDRVSKTSKPREKRDSVTEKDATKVPPRHNSSSGSESSSESDSETSPRTVTSSRVKESTSQDLTKNQDIVKPPAEKESSANRDSDGSASGIRKPKRNIFEKRTVGQIFEDAKERYLARKENRETARRVFSSA